MILHSHSYRECLARKSYGAEDAFAESDKSGPMDAMPVSLDPAKFQRLLCYMRSALLGRGNRWMEYRPVSGCNMHVPASRDVCRVAIQ